MKRILYDSRLIHNMWGGARCLTEYERWILLGVFILILTLSFLFFISFS